MKTCLASLVFFLVLMGTGARADDDLRAAVAADYEANLEELSKLSSISEKYHALLSMLISFKGIRGKKDISKCIQLVRYLFCKRAHLLWARAEPS